MVRSFSKHAAPLAALAMGAALSGCSFSVDWNDNVSGVALSELDMSGDAPNAVKLAGPDKVEITSGDSFDIVVEGNAEAGEALRFDLNGNDLTIARDSDVYDGSKSAIVKLTIPPAANLAIAGSGAIEADTMADDAEIEIAGSGKIDVAAIDSDELEVQIAGSGKVSGAGTAKDVSIEIAGSGDVQLGELKADDVSIQIAGSGDVDIASDGDVTASIAGSGDIVVTGTATCTSNSIGSGSLTCRPAESAAADSEAEEAAAD